MSAEERDRAKVVTLGPLYEHGRRRDEKSCPTSSTPPGRGIATARAAVLSLLTRARIFLQRARAREGGATTVDRGATTVEGAPEPVAAKRGNGGSACVCGE